MRVIYDRELGNILPGYAEPEKPGQLEIRANDGVSGNRKIIRGDVDRVKSNIETGTLVAKLKWAVRYDGTQWVTSDELDHEIILDSSIITLKDGVVQIIEFVGDKIWKMSQAGHPENIKPLVPQTE